MAERLLDRIRTQIREREPLEPLARETTASTPHTGTEARWFGVVLVRSSRWAVCSSGVPPHRGARLVPEI